MKRILFTMAAIFATWAAAGQYRDSESLRERLRWGDEKLHVMLDTRFDLRYETGMVAGDEFAFKGQSLRLWFEGEIIPGVRYRLRHRLNKLQTPLADGLAEATDNMWIAFDVGHRKEWTITVGKQSVQMGTFEYDYNPADIYLSTMVNSDFDNHKIGVNFAYRFLGQVISLQVFNSGAPQFAAQDYDRKSFAGSLLWQGSLFEGALKTRWAYTLLQHDSRKFYTWVTAGVQVNAGDFTAELDYYFGDRQMDYGSVIGQQGLTPVRDQSASVNLRYGQGRWRPFIKGIWDKRHDMALERSAYQNFGAEAVVEFYPFIEHKFVDDLRFHLAYSYNCTQFLGPWSDTSARYRHTVLVGMRWFFNVK